jgi:hypothetical protein
VKDSASIPLASVLELVAMQLEIAMQQAAAQVEELSGSIAGLSALAGQTGSLELTAETRRAMMAMQFHDQLVQRVTHVRQALADLHDELRSGDSPDWVALVARMRSHYTMEDERRLFDMVLGDLAGTRAPREQEALPGSTELF